MLWSLAALQTGVEITRRLLLRAGHFGPTGTFHSVRRGLGQIATSMEHLGCAIKLGNPFLLDLLPGMGEGGHVATGLWIPQEG